MKTMAAAEAKMHFGALLDAAQREPVTIAKKGRPVTVMMSMQDYEEYKTLKLEKLRRQVAEGAAQADRGEFSNKSVDEIVNEAKRERDARKV
jgi:prevent-host-death family protein